MDPLICFLSRKCELHRCLAILRIRKVLRRSTIDKSICHQGSVRAAMRSHVHRSAEGGVRHIRLHKVCGRSRASDGSDLFAVGRVLHVLLLPERGAHVYSAAFNSVTYSSRTEYSEHLYMSIPSDLLVMKSGENSRA